MKTPIIRIIVKPADGIPTGDAPWPFMATAYQFVNGQWVPVTTEGELMHTDKDMAFNRVLDVLDSEFGEGDYDVDGGVTPQLQ